MIISKYEQMFAYNAKMEGKTHAVEEKANKKAGT